MPLRKRDGMWHYRFWEDSHEYTGNTGVPALEVTGRSKSEERRAQRNLDAAKQVEAEARRLVRSGRSHELKLQVRPFNEAAGDFLAWAQVDYKAVNSYKRLRTSFASLTEFFGRKPVSGILRGHVLDFKAWRRKEHAVKNITVRHDLLALSKAFGYFIDHNWARENPVRSDDVPSDKDAVRMYILTQDEEQRYFAAARRYPALHDVARIMLDQGCRPEEVLNLRITDIDLERSYLTIREGKSRAARRTLRLTAKTREICAYKIMNSASLWLFPGKRPGTHLAKLNGPHGRVLDGLATCKCGHARDDHREARCACGCQEFREASRLGFVLYDLRHTFATREAEANMPIATLAQILGHGDLRSVMKYVHIRQQAMDAAMEASNARAENKTVDDCSSGFRPVSAAKKRESEGSTGTFWEDLSGKRIN